MSTATTMSFAVGSLVKARGREWVVLPESEDDLLMLRPLGGTEDEVTGIYLPLEKVEPAEFEPPDPTKIGDYRSCRMLRDAVRLGFRSSAGPFRSFARLAVEPRPYQLVPLLMALKLDPVRLLISDDVGIGKTVEACLVARELIDRGECQRLAVLCPPHLAEQWQAELRDKFHIDAELVLAGTAARLDRQANLNQSIFDIFPFTVVSMDYIKTDRRRDDFLRACPELVIVDEAHTCSHSDEGRGGRHQRNQLIKGLSDKPDQHMILVTATPHSGKEAAFRSLLSLLDPKFNALPEDMTGKANEHHRRNLAQHFIQRKRRDIESYLDSDTFFPEREDSESHYKLTSDYRKLFDRALNYARETIQEEDGKTVRQRVRWWSALALLRSLASSPAAAATTLRSRASNADAESTETADEIGRNLVLDRSDADSGEEMDVSPGSDTGDEDEESKRNRRRLLEMARMAEALMGDGDEKLMTALKLVKRILKDGYRPILFCRFIPTAEYVAESLRERLPKKTEIIAVTGKLPPAERVERVQQLADAQKEGRPTILVCTDCLSEGINLQEYFDAVMHYDLSWNPTRHEQREGRVDRYGQSSEKVRALTYYGVDNQIDGIVLDVLLRKHRTIRSSLGISVPVPADTEQVVEAVFAGLLLREQSGNINERSQGVFDFMQTDMNDLHTEWEAAADKEKRSRTMFAQETIKVEEVRLELDAIRQAIGSGIDVERFAKDSLEAHEAVVSSNGSVSFDLSEVKLGLKEAMGDSQSFKARFELPVNEGELYLTRTHPIVEGLATFVMDTALDPHLESVAARCGVIRTDKVERRTTLLLLRFRYHIVTRKGDKEDPLLAEDCQVLAFESSPQNAKWLEGEQSAFIEGLLQAAPKENITPDQARDFVSRVVDDFDRLQHHLEDVAKARGQELLEAHRRVRTASRAKGIQYRVEEKLPPDVLGIYVYLPA